MLRYFARLLSRLSAAEGSAVPHTRKRSRTAAAMLFLAAALMAMTFDMTGSQFDATVRRFVGRIVS